MAQDAGTTEARRTIVLMGLLWAAFFPVESQAQTSPAVASFSINHGAFSTTGRRVTLNNVCTGRPTHYVASERSSFSGASWETYSAAAAFTLSLGNGTKTVYFKVWGAGGASPVVHDTITLGEVATPVVRSFSINKGASATPTRRVTLGNVCAGRPTHYMAGERSSFSGASWKTYSTTPSFTLSLGNATKRVYFKVKNPGGESPVASDTIRLSEVAKPSVRTLSINNGASATSTRRVTLNNACTGTPTHYIAAQSSSFSGARWQTYSTAPSFTLSSGTATKTVYLKVKNAAGESSSKRDTITLR